MAIVCKVCLASPATVPDKNLAPPFNQDKVLCDECYTTRKKLNMRRLITFLLTQDGVKAEQRRRDAERIAHEQLVTEKL